MRIIKIVAGIGTAIMAIVGAFYSIAILVFLIETVKDCQGDEAEKASDPIKPLVVRTWRRKYSEIPPRNEEKHYGF